MSPPRLSRRARVVGETPSRIDGIPLQTEVAGAVQDVWCGVGLGPAADVGAKIVRRDFKSGGVSRLIRSTGRDVVSDNVEHGRGGAVEVGECRPSDLAIVCMVL